MNRLVSATLELEKRRKALGSLLDTVEEKRGEDFDAQVTAAKTAITTAQTAQETAALAEPEVPEHRQDNPEGAELRGMLERADVGRIFQAAFEKRGTEGPEKELQAHYGIASHAVPLAMLETRAVTPAPVDTGASQAQIVQPVFHEGDAAYMSVAMPTVGSGDAVYPVLTSRPTVGGPHTDSSAVAETTGAFPADMLAPSRLSAAFFYRHTDAARFAGMGEALREALSSGLSEALDKEIVDQIVTDVTRVDATAADDFESYRKRFVYDLIEGRFASMESDIRLLAGSDTLGHMATKYRGNSADDSAVDSLRRISGGVRVSPHVAATAASKQDALVRRGSRMDAVAPLWQGVQLIIDDVTKASTGEVVVTGILLAAFKVIRVGGFARIQAQHA